ncbi:hypothetical protein B841_04990 [Corynebacterium maris DSM 45190]|uniref:L,D-TPase catalytic domain-containing protein n=1 Tax=Corynebacterium maris DSM 45190 TaxID=1224163 RepID=S5TIE2_9CORY|nr:hypothetical protein B841_04990 [Corynebacterium maris DSM 45190]
MAGVVSTVAVAGLAIGATVGFSGESGVPAESSAPSSDLALETAPDPVPEPAPEPVPEVIEPAPFDYGECPPVARACVDLDGERAWLQENGEVTYGAVPIGQGGPGYETPRSEFHVTRKVKDEVSYIYDMEPMPYAVYFTNSGHAFHEGDPNGDSHGCVRLPPGDAEVFFDSLDVYDLVHIY